MKTTIAVALMLGGVSLTQAGQDATPAPEETSVYVVANGDSLWKLAGKHYGNPDAWPLIYKLNKDSIKNPHWIFPGQTITVPAAFCSPRKAEEAAASKKDEPAPEDVVVVKEEGTGAFEEVGAEGLISTGADIKPAQAVKEAAPEEVSSSASASVAPAKPKPVITVGGGTASVGGGVETQPPAQPPAYVEPPKNFSTKEKVAWGNIPKNTVSEIMPKDQIWGFPYEASRQVPADWKEDGTVKSCDPENEFDETASDEDLIVVDMKAKVAVGDSLTVYRRSDYVRDAKGKRVGLRIAVSALLEVEKIEDGRIFARVRKLVNPVSNGDLIKKE